MHLELIGSVGYQAGAVGIVLFSIAYLLLVRWWTDTLGRVLASVICTLSLILVMVALRQLDVELPGGLLVWRAGVFLLFGIVVWMALGTFVWSQFFAPRLKSRLGLQSRKEYRNEEVDGADSGAGGHGDSERSSGGHQ